MDARKHRMEWAAAWELARGCREVIAGRGARSHHLDPADPAQEAELRKRILGPRGTLRAPTLRIGDTLLVGYCEPAWVEFFT